MEPSGTATESLSAPRWRRSPFTVAAVGLLVLFTAAFALHGYLIWRDKLRDASLEAQLLTQLFAQASEAAFARVAGNVRVIGDRLLELDARKDHAGIAALMQEFAEATPGFKRVVVLRTSGERVFLSAPLGQGAVADPLMAPPVAPTFEGAPRKDGLVIARTFRNPYGDWVMPVRYMVRDRDGAPRLFVGGGLSVEQQDYFLARMSLPEGYNVRLLRTDGYVQFSQPLAEEYREQLFSKPLPEPIRTRVAELTQGEQGGFTNALGLDGVRRLGAYQRLTDYDLVAVVSLPRSKVYAAWLEQMKFSAALFALFVLVGGGLLAAARRLQRVAEQERVAADAARARLAAVVETTGDAVITRRPGGEILTWNAAAERMFGWTAQEAIGRDISIFSPERYRHQARENTSLLEQGRPAPSFETVRLRKDGTTIDVQISVSGVYDAQGRLELVAAIFRDVTETHRIAAALRTSSERLEKVFRSSPAASLLLRVHPWAVLEVNDTWERTYGWRHDELIGRDPDDLGVWVDPAERDNFRRGLQAEGRMSGYLARSRTKGGALIDVLVSGEIIEDEGGRIALIMVLDVTEQRRAEAALRVANERLAKVFRNNPGAIVIANTADGSIVDVNEAYERMFGCTREELVGKGSVALGIWADPSERDELYRRLARDGRVQDFQASSRRRNGEEFQRLIAAEIIEEGDQRLLLAISIDLTERLRAEAALRESEERYRKLVEVSPDAIYVVKEARITYANEGAVRLFRARDVTDLVGRSVFDLTHPDCSDLARARLQALADGAASVPRIEYQFIGLDGVPIEIEVASARFTIGGEHAALVIARDVSERKRTTTALRDSEQRFRALVELSSDFYWRTDEQHRFTLRTGEILRRMRLPADPDYGRTRWEIGVINLSEDEWAAHRAVLGRREEFRDLLTARYGQDGRKYWAQISGTPLFDASGNFLGYHGTGRDVTVEEEAKEALRQLNAGLERTVAERTAELRAANRELETFSYSVSHDLRTPLRGIDGFSQVLLDQHAAQLDPSAQRLLGRIRAGAQRMGRLITDLLALSRVTRAAIRPEDVDLSALAAQIAEELAPEAQGRVVEWSIAPGMRVRGDAGLLRIVLANLMGNALKYTRKASTACIEVGMDGRADDRIRFFVRDNGAGFDMAFRERLFQPFQRLHGEHEFEGTGIGLATVQRVIARHGGEVDAEGAPGKGATFRFTLPA